MKLKTIISLVGVLTVANPVNTVSGQRFRHVASSSEVKERSQDELIKEMNVLNDKIEQEKDSITYLDSLLRVRSVEEIMSSIQLPAGAKKDVNVVFGPWIFSGYRKLPVKEFDNSFSEKDRIRIWRELEKKDKLARLMAPDSLALDDEEDTIAAEDNSGLRWGALDSISAGNTALNLVEDFEEELPIPEILMDSYIPEWLRSALTSSRIQQDFMYSSMIANPSTIDYAYWDLPVPPRLPDEDYSFASYIKKLDLPVVTADDANISDMDIAKRHWLHLFNTALQFSQAYLSDNWYQGGNNYLSLLFNFLWDVQLNTVYHPNLMFRSVLSYKLGLNTERNDPYRKYSISQDLFQYNLTFGIKATNNWYYSLTGQFKTQLLNNYKKNTDIRMTSLLSPGELNVGLGMTYSKTNKNKTVVFNASIAPISYNLKTCIDPEIDPTQYNVRAGHKTNNEIGSSAELTFNAKVFGNVTYKTRLFLFSDYSYFLNDWENTLDFQFNKFFSTQIYAHLRYDSSAPSDISGKWHKWMLKEILSVGLSYTFSTK